MADVSLALDLRMEVSEKTSHRVRKYGFGDGYEAMAVDGIYSRQTEYGSLQSQSKMSLRRRHSKTASTL